MLRPRTPSSTPLSPPRRAALQGTLAVLAVCAGATLATADTLRGTVVGPDGRAVAGAQVMVSGASAVPVTVRTDDAGAFVVDHLSPGRVDIRAWTPAMDAVVRGVDAASTGVAVRLAVRALAETLTVTASHVDMPLSQLADSVTVFSRSDLDALQLTTLGDALRLVPGFVVARNGGPGSVTSVFPRGGDSDFTMVLVDGVRANAFGGGMDLSQVPITDAERVEIVRGPQSALHGSDAIGGVVQIISPRGGPLAATAAGELGGRDSRRAQANARAGAGRWQWHAAADHARDDGYTGAAPADQTAVTNDDATASRVAAGLGWRHPGGGEVRGTMQFVETDRGAPGAYGSNPAGNFFGVDRASRSLTRRRSAAVHAESPVGGAASRLRVRADLDASDYDLEFRSTSTSRGETRRSHARVQVDGAVSAGLSGSAGADWVGEQGRSTFITAGPVEVPVERGVMAGFGEVRWQPVSRLSLTAGTRAERITRAALAANPSEFSSRPAFADDTVVSVNPKLTAAWILSAAPAEGASTTRLHAAAGTGIRPPDAFEIAFTDNDGLKPERSTSVEAGVSHTLAHGAVHLAATWFHNRYDDLIVSVGRFSSASRYRTDNIANARARGVELSASARPSAELSAQVNFTWLDGEILAVDGVAGQAPSPFTPGDRLLRRPRHQGSLSAFWTLSRWQMFASATMRGTTLDVEPNFGSFGGLFENEGHAVVNAGSAWTIRPQLAVVARVVNVFAADYEDTLGFPALGRTAYVGVRVTTRR